MANQLLCEEMGAESLGAVYRFVVSNPEWIRQSVELDLSLTRRQTSACRRPSDDIAIPVRTVGADDNPLVPREHNVTFKQTSAAHMASHVGNA